MWQRFDILPMLCAGEEWHSPTTALITVFAIGVEML